MQRSSVSDVRTALVSGISCFPSITVLLQEELTSAKVVNLGHYPLSLLRAAYPDIQIYQHPQIHTVQLRSARSWAVSLVLDWLSQCSKAQTLLSFHRYLPESTDSWGYHRCCETIRAAEALHLPIGIVVNPTTNLMRQIETNEQRFREIVETLYLLDVSDNFRSARCRFVRTVTVACLQHKIVDGVSMQWLRRENLDFNKDLLHMFRELQPTIGGRL
jgi:hypothetical protein